MEPEAVNRMPDSNQRNSVGNMYEPILYKSDNAEVNVVYDTLVAEHGEHFIEYLNHLGLLNDSNLVVLSAMNHFYYEADDFTKVGALINLKPLNHIKRIDLFLKSIDDVLSEDGKLIGCFIDSLRGEEEQIRIGSSLNRYLGHNDLIDNGIISSNPVFNRVLSFLDSRVYRKFTVNIVRNLLKNYGFIISDITEIRGITYFSSFKHSK